MIRLQRTDASHPGFIELVRRLDAELAARDGAEHTFYAQFNTLDRIQYTVVAYVGTEPVGCGAIKPFGTDAMEVKRMYVRPDHRGRGIAGRVLNELENWAAELDYARCVLETGLRQHEAIALYHKCGYAPIPNYGPYAGVENSRCFAKQITGTEGVA